MIRNIFAISAVLGIQLVMTPLKATEPDFRLVSGGQLSGVVYDGEQFVAAGYYGMLATSVDGVEWEFIDLHNNWWAESIVYAQGLYVVAGGGSIYTSADLEDWTPVFTAGSAWLRALTYGNGLFMAVGRNGMVVTSADGIEWTERSSGQTSELRGVAAGAGRFVAVGVGGLLISSADGDTWQAHDSGTPVAISAVGFDGSRFIVQGPSGQVRSVNGLDWTPASSSPLGYGAIAHGPTGYVVVGNFGRISFSVDADTWQSPDPLLSSNRLKGVAYGNGTWVAVGNGADIVTSRDGVNWRVRWNAGIDAGLQQLEFANGLFWGVGASGRIVTSRDGSNWYRSTAPGFGILFGTATGNGRFVAVGVNGTILHSDTAEDWQAADSPVSTELRSVVFGMGQWVAVGNQGVVLRSMDGIDWTTGSIGEDTNLIRVLYGNGRFVAYSSDRLFSSEDGVSWQVREQPSPGSLGAGRFMAGEFWLATTSGGLRSLDGISWSSVSFGISSPSALAYGNGMYFAAGSSGVLAYSQDGDTWNQVSGDERPVRQTAAAAAFGMGRFLMSVQNRIYATPAYISPHSIPVVITRVAIDRIRLQWPADPHADYRFLAGHRPEALVRRPDWMPTLVDGTAFIELSVNEQSPNFFKVLQF